MDSQKIDKRERKFSSGLELKSSDWIDTVDSIQCENCFSVKGVQGPSTNTIEMW